MEDLLKRLGEQLGKIGEAESRLLEVHSAENLQEAVFVAGGAYQAISSARDAIRVIAIEMRKQVGQ